MLSTLIRRAAQATESTYNATGNLHQLRKVWPPDFTKLTPQAQLRFEKKYKRRVALKYARPRWNKAVKIVQLVTVTVFVTVMFFSELDLFGQKYRASDEFQKHVKSIFGAIDADKRYERRSDAPAPPPAREDTPK
ncbi:hypothetical protein HYQ45_011177 [Verticillium longisporum]|uniref:Uncharacterized protein n=3 Tax=Verticillium TaxID=1036719 RepID=G2XBY3_VERDV|nr:uncharacterized protein VDAG_07665 [Verticillium dahliae VdLs.17]KAF3349460.1 ATPase family AAA domain-containing protein 5 [Verticillium dahliae VDG2]KAG7129808.1 hypothetical protein HYQ45_011177 [Verticillium longisporum]KAH6699207.1 hypothetical protein EV126DRAFT_515735 [Verticillium dahliae]EGY16501.1 hypothetical protein VDAG_07665 [Verticillium dahliae VdLs.17]PNH32757.1 hypothetical protein BJF96_g3962 [Verticillium dahliae]